MSWSVSVGIERYMNNLDQDRLELLDYLLE